jgi:serine phosphatase RsbU (regulator of sigma subunit)
MKVEDLLQGYKFAGYRIQEFPSESKVYLKEIAEILEPYKGEIVDSWLKRQYSAWIPHNFKHNDLYSVFAKIFELMLTHMGEEKPESCLDELEMVGADLATKSFPFEALIMSLHFLEESYLPFLLDNSSENKTGWLISIDEFFHAALASIATSYFRVNRKALLDEARVGQVVQQSLLPDIPRRLTDLDVEYVYLPAMSKSRVGGDLVDVFSIGSNHAAFIIGDLSGHGVEAAAESVMIRSLFRGYMREEVEVEKAVTRINNVLNQELREGKFVTLLAATYDGNGTIRLVGAGHPYPLVAGDRYDVGNGCGVVECDVVELDGIALAVDDDIDFVSKDIYIGEGDAFVAYTDGLIEARNGREFFGEQRVIDILKEMKGCSSRAIAEKLTDEAIRFAGGNIVDDMAILVLRRIRA